ncbi:hypothetical protein N656DRAFT_435858 [Canariomyces notabilis]|uniref:Transmembrane protein n=1 Tax=Canariomyces notabilis TaxID=2074819 RepID=A0AAN6QJF1_9PEZI|nr:hypothetical protein N656DRAFT_435858 [Canariomyces arenarius]
MEGIKRFADTIGYTSTTGIVLWSTLGLPLRIFLGFLSVVGVCAVLYGLYWLASNSPKTLAFFFSLGFWIGITYCLAQLDQKRNLLGSVLGEEYGGSQWGFGQVLAVFAWMPLLLETVVGILESVARACTSSSDQRKRKDDLSSRQHYTKMRPVVSLGDSIEHELGTRGNLFPEHSTVSAYHRSNSILRD